MTYTKGPWMLCDEGDYSDYGGECRVILGDGMRLAVVLTGGDEECARESNANAHLIAAAPDYAEAASLMIASEQSGGDLWWKGFEMLKAAHAKAGFDFPSGEEATAKAKGDAS